MEIINILFIAMIAISGIGMFVCVFGIIYSIINHEKEFKHRYIMYLSVLSGIFGSLLYIIWFQ